MLDVGIFFLILSTLRPLCFFFSVLDKKKIQNLMREGGKTFKKIKTFNLFLEKLMRSTPTPRKKSIGQFFGKFDDCEEK